MQESPYEKNTFSRWLQLIIGILLLGSGIILSFWLFGVAKDFIYSPDKVPLIEKMFHLAGKEQIINVSIEGKQMATIESTGFFKYFLFIFIALIILFSIGRVIVALLDAGMRALWNAGRS